MRKTLNAYTVTIQLEAGKTAFESSFRNDEDNLAKNNEGVKKALEFLAKQNESRYVGVLVVRQDMEWSDTAKRYIGGELYNTYSHICCNKSNWVTVAEAKKFLMNM